MLLGKLLAFALGVYLSIGMIAALYQVLDLWYRIGAYYTRVTRGVLKWTLAIAAVVWLLSPPFRLAFTSGLVGFLLFYLSLFQLRHVLIFMLRERPDSARAAERDDRRPG